LLCKTIATASEIIATNRNITPGRRIGVATKKSTNPRMTIPELVALVTSRLSSFMRCLRIAIIGKMATFPSETILY
jgi:hypothetical protein